MESRFVYYAYISYSPKDEKWAKWLQNKLHHYKIPTSLNKSSQGSVPKKVGPIFRNQTDLVTEPLESNLRKELTDSRYLIVVCSPDSAKSDVVNREIIQFKELGREDRIIPFIISGEPNANNDNECFPLALQGTELLGASLNELTEEEAFIKIVAGLLGLKFDVLWNREKREQKRRQRRFAIIGGVLTLFICFGGWGYWDFNYHEKAAYFSNYVETFGVANGIDELTKDQVESRNMSYKITEVKGKVISFEKINSSGSLCGDDTLILNGSLLPVPDMPEKIEYSYDESGSLDKAIYFNNEGTSSITLDYTSRDAATIYNSDQLVAGQESVLQASDQLAEKKDDGSESNIISQYVYQYDEQGKTIRKLFCNIYNSVKPNENGVFGVAYAYDEKGQLIEVTYVDENGEPSIDRYGVAKTEYIRNQDDHITQISYNGIDGELVKGKDGYALCEAVYDQNGNLVSCSYQGIDEKLIACNDGCTSWEATYDDKGMLIKLVKYDINGDIV